MEQVPHVFMPYKLRNGSKYRNLRSHRFSSEKVDWVCSKFGLPGQKARQSRALTAFCNNHNLLVEEVLVWIQLNDGSISSDMLPVIARRNNLPLDLISLDILCNHDDTTDSAVSLGEVLALELTKTRERRHVHLA